MASLVLSGDSSGSITVSAPSVAGSNTQTLVAVTGTLAPIVSGTAVSASGTSVDFTGIPSWVKRITVMFSGVSTNGTGAYQIQIGDSGGIENTGYVSSGSNIGTGSTGVSGFTTGFALLAGAIAANTYQGSVVLTLIDSATNTWVSSGNLVRSSNDSISVSAGTKSLSATLTQLRIIGSNTGDPSGTFDAGTINILFE